MSNNKLCSFLFCKNLRGDNKIFCDDCRKHVKSTEGQKLLNDIALFSMKKFYSMCIEIAVGHNKGKHILYYKQRLKNIDD